MKRIFLAFTLAANSVAALAQGRAPATDTTNIAAASNGGRVLSVTSTLDNDAAYAGKNLIDGQFWTPEKPKSSKGWSSNRYDPIAMDAVTLGFASSEIYKLGRVVVNPATDLNPERWAKDIEVQVSTDTAEGPFVPVAQITLKAQARPQAFDLPTTEARFVRLLIRSNFGSDRAVALGEVEIYEAIDNSDALGALIGRLENTIGELSRYRAAQLQLNNGGGQRVANEKFSPATIQTVQMLDEGEDLAPIGKTNIAAAKNGGRILAYSSVYNADPLYGPDKLIDSENFSPADNKGSFGWASQGFKPGQEFVTIGFKGDATRSIGKIVFNPLSNQSDLRWARRIEIQSSNENPKDGPWKTVATINLKVDVSGAANQEFLIAPTPAKFLRFVFRANGPGVVLPNADPNVNSDRSVSLGEIEVYEANTNGDQLKGVIGRLSLILNDMKALRRKTRDGETAPEATPVVWKANKTKTPAKTPVGAPKTTPKRRGELEAGATKLRGRVG